MPEGLADALEHRTSDGMVVEAFGEGRHFATSEEFLASWGQDEHDICCKYTSRGADTVMTKNLVREEKFLAANIPLDSEKYLEGIIPGELVHQSITRRCKHGLLMKTRGTGERQSRKSRFLACPARITATAERDKEGNWSLVTRNEITYHNHKCTQDMVDNFSAKALLTNPQLAREVAQIDQAGAQAANICDTIATNYGIRLKIKDIGNFKRSRAGFRDATSNMEALLERFAAFPGSSALVEHDNNGDIAIVVTQSAAQREFFELYGDNLILDWTHNTNNMGLYLGSFVVTSASGHGVSVCDFLCAEQSEDIMTEVFEYFVQMNPGAVDKIRSVVIDKDYKEWRVLERVFPKTTVLLCQFHVAKWFNYVVTMHKYNRYMRDRVLTILKKMIYAQNQIDFDVLMNDLERLLADTCPDYIAYMKTRWYNCIHMWSNCQRGRFFSGLNTATNRIESIWNQLKARLGKKLRIDLCLKAIFRYQTAVLLREHRVITEHKYALIPREEVNPFMRAAMREVCDFASDHVAKEWKSHRLHDGDSSAPYEWWRNSGKICVKRDSPDAATYEVSEGLDCCTCDFSTMSALPCRHLIYVARHVLKLDAFPTSAVSERWKLRTAYYFAPTLHAIINLIQSLRTSLLGVSDGVLAKLVDPGFIEKELDPAATTLSLPPVFFCSN